MKKYFVMLVAVGILSGCVNDMAFSPLTDEKRDFIYDYSVPGKSKVEIFKSARNFLATTYGDSKSIGRVEDEEEGVIIAKAVTTWHMDTGMVKVKCLSGYDLNFIAKAERARLQLIIKKAPQQNYECGWTEPSKQGYPEVVRNLDILAQELERAILGDSDIERLKDF